MKKTNITFGYDDEKLSALKMYMEQKDADFSDELLKAVDSMYAKYVPSNVRDFIDMREKSKPVPKLKKSKNESEEKS